MSNRKSALFFEVEYNSNLINKNNFYQLKLIFKASFLLNKI